MAEEKILSETDADKNEVEEKVIEEKVEVQELDRSPLEIASEWLKLNQENLKYLDQSKVRILEQLLTSPEQLNEAEIAEAQKLNEDLEKALDKKFKQNFAEVKNGLVELREEMFKIPGYVNLPDELQEVALNTFTNCEIRLANTKLIDELKEIYDNFKNNVYPDLSYKIYALENPNVLPINLIEILDSLPGLSFNNLEELDSALAQVREAAIAKLNKVKSKN